MQVRALGRGGGKGPLRRAPEQVYASGKPPGVIRSELVPEEVRGLTKSGSLTQILPSEAALLGAKWREGGDAEEAEAGEWGEGVGEQEALRPAEGVQQGDRRHPARLLFLAKLAENGLMSYQRAGVPLLALDRPDVAAFSCLPGPMASQGTAVCLRAFPGELVCFVSTAAECVLPPGHDVGQLGSQFEQEPTVCVPGLVALSPVTTFCAQAQCVRSTTKTRQWS